MCQIGDYKRAVLDYKAALQVDPRSSYALYNCGIARDRIGDFAGAVDDFTAAIALEPDSNADFYHNRGFSLRKQVGPFSPQLRQCKTVALSVPCNCSSVIALSACDTWFSQYAVPVFTVRFSQFAVTAPYSSPCHCVSVGWSVPWGCALLISLSLCDS